MKYREFWILNMLHANNEGRVTGYDCNIRAQKSVDAQPDVILNSIHVIEMKAYTAQQEVLKELVSVVKDIPCSLFVNLNTSIKCHCRRCMSLTKAKGMIDE